MGQSAGFWDRIAVRYSKQPIGDEAAYQKKLAVTREYLRPDMQLLECGCGTGSTALLHAPFVKHIQAIDISSKMIEIAQSKAEAQQVNNISFTQSSIDDFAHNEQTFDAVLGLSILHLVENPRDVINKLHRLLKPGGLLITSTMCIGERMKWFKLIAPVGRLLRLMPLVTVFTADELRADIINAGFVIDYQWQPSEKKALFIVATKSQ